MGDEKRLCGASRGTEAPRAQHGALPARPRTLPRAETGTGGPRNQHKNHEKAMRAVQFQAPAFTKRP